MPTPMPNEAGINPYEHSIPMEYDWNTDDRIIDDAVEDLFHLFECVDGNKRLLRKHLRLILIVCSRMFKYNPNAYVGYVRNNNFNISRERRNPFGYTTHSLINVVDALVGHGFLEHHMGFNGLVGIRRSSRFKATNKLTDFIQDYELDLLGFRRELVRGGIILKDDSKKYVYDYEDTEQTNRSRNILTSYNELIEQTDIRLSNKESEECYFYDRVQSYRIFNNSDFTQGGRFYSNWWLQCKRTDRPYITINNQSTVELDYKANHLYFIYALEGVDIPNFPNDDPYNIANEIDRSIIKSVFTKSLNSNNKYEAAGAIRKEIRTIENEEEKKMWKQVISNQTSFDRVTSILVQNHPVLENYLCSGMGVKLQFMDSQIAEIVLNEMTNHEIPTLCIHDSFIVQRSNEQQLRDIMKEAYIIFGYPNHIPSIHKKNTLYITLLRQVLSE